MAHLDGSTYAPFRPLGPRRGGAYMLGRRGRNPEQPFLFVRSKRKRWRKEKSLCPAVSRTTHALLPWADGTPGKGFEPPHPFGYTVSSGAHLTSLPPRQPFLFFGKEKKSLAKRKEPWNETWIKRIRKRLKACQNGWVRLSLNSFQAGFAKNKKGKLRPCSP